MTCRSPRNCQSSSCCKYAAEWRRRPNSNKRPATTYYSTLAVTRSWVGSLGTLGKASVATGATVSLTGNDTLVPRKHAIRQRGEKVTHCREIAASFADSRCHTINPKVH